MCSYACTIVGLPIAPVDSSVVTLFGVHCIIIYFCVYRVDPLNRQYIGAVCGLGYNTETGLSHYPEHDLELVFDTLITQEDIDAVIIIITL